MPAVMLLVLVLGGCASAFFSSQALGFLVAYDNELVAKSVCLTLHMERKP
jgi:hypothetical protein